MSAQAAILPVARHAATAYNVGGSRQERSRGHSDVPADPAQLEAQGPEIAAEFKRQGVTRIISSDLPRAADTAKFVGEQMDVPVELRRQLRTWDTGEMSGKLEKETLPVRKKYIRFSDMRPKGGEEFDAFFDRFSSELNKWVRHNIAHPDHPVGLILHGHEVMSLEQAISGGEVKPEQLDTLDELYPPGSVILLRIHGDPPRQVKIERVLPELPSTGSGQRCSPGL